MNFPVQPKIPEERDELIQLVAKRIRNTALKREDKYKKKQGPEINFSVGQEVLIKNHRLSNNDDCEIKKLFNVYEGPYYITKIISDTTIAVRNDETGN